MHSCLRCGREFKRTHTGVGIYKGHYCPVCHFPTMTEDTEQQTITFDDEGALDMFIAMAELDDGSAENLREAVEEHGYGEPIPLPDEYTR